MRNYGTGIVLVVLMVVAGFPDTFQATAGNDRSWRFRDLF
jgi:hypothetical protein